MTDANGRSSDSNNENNPTNPKITLGKRPFSKIDLDGHDLPPSPAPSSPRNGKRYALATELVYTEGADQYGASSTPIYQVSGCSRSRVVRLHAYGNSSPLAWGFSRYYR